MKKLLTALLVLLAVGSLCLCSRRSQGGGASGSQGSASESQSVASGSSLIGIAMPETHVLRWVKDGNSLKAEAEQRGYRAEVQWGNADQTQQNQQIQSFLTQGAKALVVGCINDGVGSVISEAARDKVAVIAYDRIIPNSADYDYFITFNNFKVGQLQAQSIETALDLNSASASSPKYITLFAGSPTDGNAFFFYDGAMSVLNPYVDSGVLKVVGPYPRTSSDSGNFQRIATENWQAPIAKTRMENLLNNDARDVTLDAVLAPNDTLGRAIIEACKADAKYRTKLPTVTGQDAEFDSALSIKNGDQYSTVFKDTAKLAEAAILLADQVLKGQSVSIPGAVLASGDLAKIGDTGRKVVKTYLLDPILVTNSNLNVPVDAGFYEADQASQLR
ncbi:MAG: sugar-binding protein [Treponema sp.]|jgi:putative multiple sugar transport system substrate-binding protein|nr:sugar-binding protein [Treponema sp.]